jgi:glycosyltransferase involved in cell wall biosynthesis
MKIAFVHDYFTQRGGAEKVADEIFRMLPGASLFSIVALPDMMPKGLRDKPIVTTWMQYLPFMRKAYRLYVALYPFAVRSLDLSGFDVVVTSSSGFVKGVSKDDRAIHICYCHTPMRWAWDASSYIAREKLGLMPRLLFWRFIGSLRKWDLKASRQPDFYVANSEAVAARIQKCYGRFAAVIHPPIDLNRFSASVEQEDYYLILARLVSYKCIDLAVQACTKLNRRLIVIGEGPDRARLESMAGPSISFLGRLPDATVEHYASRCKALLFPGEEDFGMAPLEIAAAGRPTIAFRGGGAVETIVEGVTGMFFDRQDADNLACAIERFEKQTWNPSVIQQHARGFSTEVFKESFLTFLERVGCDLQGNESFTTNSQLAWDRRGLRASVVRREA